MAPEAPRWPEKQQSPHDLQKCADIACKNPVKVAQAIKADPQIWVLSGMWKWVKEWAVSSWDGTKAVFTGTGEFIGVWAAKLVHEWGDSFLQYTEEKLKPLGDVVNIAGEAIAITAFEAVNGDQSVVLEAVKYWKAEGVEFGKLPAGKQAELITKFAIQVAIGVVGAKGLWVVSKTNIATKSIDTTERAMEIGSKFSTAAMRISDGLWRTEKVIMSTKELGKVEKIHAAGLRIVANGAEAVGKSAKIWISATGRGIENTISSGAKLWVMAVWLDSGSVNSKTWARQIIDSHNIDERLPIRSTTGDMSLSQKPTSHTQEVTKTPHQLQMEASSFAREYIGWVAFIERWSGKIETCQVLRVTEDGKVLVQFADNGAMSTKTVSVMDFKKLNDPESPIPHWVTTAHIREQHRIDESIKRDGLDAFSDVHRNASYSSEKRVLHAGKELGIDRILTDKESGSLLKAHAVMQEGEWVFWYGTHSLGEKMRILQEEWGFSKEESKLLIRKGYAGESQMSAERMASSQTHLSRMKTLADSGWYKELQTLLANPTIGSQVSHVSIANTLRGSNNPTKALMAIAQDGKISAELRIHLFKDIGSKLWVEDFKKLKAGLIDDIHEASDGVLTASYQMNGRSHDLIRFTNGDMKLSGNYTSYTVWTKKVNGVEKTVYAFTKWDTRSRSISTEYYFPSGNPISNSSVK